MIEAYSFLAVFTVQILAMSVLHPSWFTRYIREKWESYYSDERFAQLYPDMEPSIVERLLTRYHILNAGIALLGLVLLCWLFLYMRHPDWDDGPVKGLVTAYSMVQVLPLLIVAVIGSSSNRKALKRVPPPVKRKAVLERRGLFDYVSPLIVGVAAFGYVLFAAFAIYVRQHPFPGFAGPLINIGIVTLVYALYAFVVYTKLYGRRSDPLESRVDRVYSTGVTVKLGMYSCIAVVVFISLDFTMALLDMQRWEPVAQSAFLVICALLCSMGLTAPPRRAGAPELHSRAMF